MGVSNHLAIPLAEQKHFLEKWIGKQTSFSSSGGGRGGKNCLSLDKSTARSTPHWGQANLANPWGTLRMALQCAQGTWIFVGSIPCAGTWSDEGIEGGGGRGAFNCTLISSGGSIWGNWQVGHTNSVTPPATVKISLQPAHRTCTPTPPPAGCGGGGTGGWLIMIFRSLVRSLSNSIMPR